jgi:2-(1,2-epoxy-1,2-dihydrophenyl)acetyl-CoA isomerase
MTNSSSRPEKSEPHVLLSEDADGVRTLTLNRPDRKNAINAQLWIELADALRAAARDDPPVALAQSKGLLNDGAGATLREALANEARAQPGNFATADSIEAYAAFAQKREPAFTGGWAVPRSE